MDQDRREYLEDRGSHQLEVEAMERERTAKTNDSVAGARITPRQMGGETVLAIKLNVGNFSLDGAVLLANAILSEVEIATRGDEPEVLHPAYGDCEVCHGRRTIAVAGPDENGQYDTEDCPACT